MPAYPTVPTQTSQLTNNSDFATNASVDTKIANLVNSAPEALDTLGELATALQTHEDAYDALLTTVGGKVDKVSGKGLSTNDYTTAEKNKLAGIASGAEVNVQSDWNATSGDAFIKNKPTIPSVGNGTITIKQAGAVKGTFTTNQSGDATIELTDNNTTVLPTRLAASSSSGYADANLAVEQGWHYMTSTGTNRPPFKQVDGQTGNDYRIMTTAYGSTWLQQIATDFRSNDMFVRRCQNGTWQPWTPIVKMGQGATPLPTDNALPRWDASRNATLQSSGVIVDDSNNMSGVATLTATTFKGSLTGNADTATTAFTANTLGNSNVGSATQPIYLKVGVPTKCTYTLGKSVPSNAVFTDTTYEVATTSAAGLMSAADKAKLDGIAAGGGGGSSLYEDWALPLQTVAQGDDTTLYFDVPINAKTIEVCFDSYQNFTFDLVLWNGNTISIDTARIDANNIPHSCSVIIDVVSGSVMLYGCDNGGDPVVIYVGNIHPSSNYRYSIYYNLAIETKGMYSSDATFWVKGTSYLSYASSNW